MSNKEINEIAKKLTEKEIEILTKHISKMLLEQMKVKYLREKKNNPLAI